MKDKLYPYIAGQVKPLSRERETELVKAYQLNGDLKARDELIRANLRFVIRVANRYKTFVKDPRDLYQEGLLGLITALNKFEWDRGMKLISYAVWYINNSVQTYIMKNRSVISRNNYKARLLFKKGGAAANPRDLSLNWRYAAEEDDGIEAQDLWVKQEATAERDVIQKELLDKVTTTVNKVLDGSKDRDKLIIQQRFFGSEPDTLQKVADDFGMSRERVRQIEAAMVKRVKELFLEQTGEGNGSKQGLESASSQGTHSVSADQGAGKGSRRRSKVVAD